MRARARYGEQHSQMSIPQEVAAAKGVDLIGLIGRHVRLRKHGQEWVGLCPFHQEKSPSFSVNPTKGIWWCFGCGKGGDAISWIREAQNLGFTEAVAFLTGTAKPSYFCGVRIAPAKHEDDDAKRRRHALTLWTAAGPLEGSLAETYLKARGIKTASAELRYAPAAEHSPTGQTFPALLARISGENGFCAVQRTYLAAEGKAKAAINPNKMTLGPMEGGAVRLRAPVELLGLAEGIETALSAAKLYQVATWATLSAQRLAKIDIPETVRNIIIFADQGEAGMREAHKACETYEDRGFGVEIIAPAADYPELSADDFNTVLQRSAA